MCQIFAIKTAITIYGVEHNIVTQKLTNSETRNYDNSSYKLKIVVVYKITLISIIPISPS